MSYTVKAADLSSIKLNEQDTVTSILQNVAIMLNTWQGEVPLYRDFGIPSDTLHRPTIVAKALLNSQIRECIEKYEPRAKVKSITFEVNKEQPDRLSPVVELEVNDA